MTTTTTTTKNFDNLLKIARDLAIENLKGEFGKNHPAPALEILESETADALSVLESTAGLLDLTVEDAIKKLGKKQLEKQNDGAFLGLAKDQVDEHRLYAPVREAGYSPVAGVTDSHVKLARSVYNDLLYHPELARVTPEWLKLVRVATVDGRDILVWADPENTCEIPEVLSRYTDECMKDFSDVRQKIHALEKRYASDKKSTYFPRGFNKLWRDRDSSVRKAFALAYARLAHGRFVERRAGAGSEDPGTLVAGRVPRQIELATVVLYLLDPPDRYAVEIAEDSATLEIPEFSSYDFGSCSPVEIDTTENSAGVEAAGVEVAGV